MKETKSVWWQPQGWLTFGSIVVVAIVIAYLVFIAVRYVMPRVRNIGKIYNDAADGQPERSWKRAPGTGGRRTVPVPWPAQRGQ